MSDPLNGVALPATHITPDVAVVIAAAPAKVYWASLKDKISEADWASLKLMASGIGEPHE